MTTLVNTRPFAGRLQLLAAQTSTAALVVGTIVGLGATNGGYFPSSWGWTALLFVWSGLIALLVKRNVTVSRLEIVYLGVFVALLCWTALSLLWTLTTAQTVYETERMLSYVTFAIALALLARRDQVTLVLGCVLAAVTGLSAYALATRLLPGQLTTYSQVAGYRLAAPLGYWNALAAIAAFGCLLALGLAARARNILLGGLAAATLVVLVPTLYFTFSRGGWLALFLGLAVLLLVDPRRLQLAAVLIVVSPWPAIALWGSYGSPALTTPGLSLGAASAQGHRLAWVIGILAILAFGATVLCSVVSERVTVRPQVRRVFGTLLVVGVLGVGGVGLVAVGGPAKVVRHALHSFRQPPIAVKGDLTKRLFDLSSNSRLNLWESALADARAHPVVGSGAGTFEEWWLRDRSIGTNVRDAHSLYLETFAELGTVGLLLLVAVLLLPVVAGIRARAHPLVPVSLAGFVAFLAHAAVDWDWEMPVVTLCALAFAATLLAAGSRNGRTVTLRPAVRFVSVAVLGVVSVFAFVAMVGNRALGQANAAADRADPIGMVAHARTAARWAPWSSEPIRIEADAALQRGDRARARSLYRKAIAKDPNNWNLWVGLALASDGPAASRALAQAAKLNPLGSEISQLRAAGL
jgi:O-Antigen ligase